MSLTFLIGGARSGKSALAVEMGRRRDGPVTYLATAPGGKGGADDDMIDRIAHHRAERPDGWSTVEEEVDLVGAVGSIDDGLVIVDCLTLWTSNLLWRERPDDEIVAGAHELAVFCAARADPVVVISNEVGLGVHPQTELGRRYRDLLGRVNQTVAATADPALLLVAGRAIILTDPWRHLHP